MRKLWVYGAVAALASAAMARADDKAMMTAEKLAGSYMVVSGEKYGGKGPKEDINDTKVTFTKDKVTIYDKGDKELYVQTYKLDPSQKPCVITMTSTFPEKAVGSTAKGLIMMEGETVKLIYALPDGEMPTDFKTKEKQLMFVMKRAK